MSKDKLLPISIFCLAISIVIGTSSISKGIENKGRFIADGISNGLYDISNTINQNNINKQEEKNNLNLYDAAEYLGISQDVLMQIMNKEETKIPYIKFGNDYIFSKSALDKWVEESRFKI